MNALLATKAVRHTPACSPSVGDEMRGMWGSHYYTGHNIHESSKYSALARPARETDSQLS